MAGPEGAGIENALSNKISPPGGPPSVDRGILVDSHEPTQPPNYSPRTRINPRLGTAIALASLFVSSIFLSGHDSATFIKPAPVEASLDSNNSDSKVGISSAEMVSDPFNPYIFISNIGEEFTVTLMHGTGPIYPNSEISFMDTAKVEKKQTALGGLQSIENIQAADQLYLDFNPDINQVSTLCLQYDRVENNAYFVDSHRVRNQADQSSNPMKIRIVPWDRRSNYSEQTFAPATLPNNTVDNYLKSCKTADDNSYIDIRTSKSLLYRFFKKTGVVSILQDRFKVFLAGVLNGTTISR